ncbi:MAG: hypothetical protein ACLGJC_05740 [Alphaproteobacteria bacterium]
MSVHALLNGPRTTVSNCVGVVTTLSVGDAPAVSLPAFVPPVPIGMLALPLRGMLRALSGREVPDEEMHAVRRAFQKAGCGPEHLQVAITEEEGCCHTVSADLAYRMADAVCGETFSGYLRERLNSLGVAGLTEDGKGGALADFESLSRLHRIAGKPRGNAPGHWHHRRGKRLSEYLAKKEPHRGVWQTEDGEWMADHKLAHDYAGYLFPAFEIWTIDLLLGNPASAAAVRESFGGLFGDGGEA